MQIQRIQWDFDAWEEYCEWQHINKANQSADQGYPAQSI